MSFRTNALKVQAFAGAMYGIQVGTTTMAQVTADITSAGGLANALNGYYTSSFGSVANATVGTTVATNLGLTGDALTNGAAYITAQLNAAAPGARGAVISTILDLFAGLTADATYGAFATAYNTKVDAANAYTGTANVAIGTVVATSTVFALTTGIDTPTGTAANETFTGAYDGASTSTFNVTDVLTGGDGTDTLNITATDDAAVTLSAALVSGIETINIRNIDGDATAQVLTVNASNFVGGTSFNSDRSTDSVTFSNLATGAAFGVIGNGTVVGGAVVAGYATTTDAVTLNIASGTKMTAGVSITGTATSATINSTGAANTIGTVDLAQASLTSVTINAATNLTGDLLSEATDQVGTDGAVTISGAATTVTFSAALDNTIKTINASGLTAGGIIATLGTLATQTVTGGEGNDRIGTGGVLTTGSVNAGSGTDTLEVKTAADLATSTLGAKYTNFETLRVNDSQDMSVISGITAVELNAMTSKAITQMTAAQAAAVKVLGDQSTGVSFALASSSGTSDVLSVTTGTGTTTAAATNLAALTANGFETINIATNAGPTSTTGANKTTTVASFTADKATTINLTGTAFSLTNAATTLASTINASALTGDGASTALGLTIGSTTFASGSTVNGSAYVDNVTIAAGTEGVTLNLAAGADLVTADVATLVADGTTDGAINGGDGTDTITVTDTSATMTDNHFTKLSNMEKLTLSATGATSITGGTAFNTAFASGATITQASKADGSALSYALGLSTVNTTIALTTAENGSDTTATNITTGSGADTVTVTASSYIGAAVALNFTIATGSGADTISVTTGTLADADATAQALTITAGTGADTITKVGTNGNDAEMTVSFVIAAGDSLTTAWDKITGYDLTATGDMADELDFAGTAAVGTLATSTDFGTITSHTISNGLASFDDAAVYATALVINSANLADVVGYLAANTATNDVVAFTYDTDSNGSADATMVFHNGATDSLVQLTGITTADSVVTTNTAAGANDIFVL